MMKVPPFAAIAFSAIMLTGLARAHGDLHDRIAWISEEIREAPAAGLFFKRGRLYLEHGEAGAALADFNETDKLAPGEFETDVSRAEACMLLGKYPQALEILNRCLDRDPSASRCFVLRARVLEHLGKPDDAIRDYRKALSITPQPEPDLLLEVSTALAENQQSAAALQVLDQGISRLGPLPSLVNSAIEIELGKGNVDAALRWIDVAQHASPRPEPWMARRASVLARAGRDADSRAAWKSLLDRISSLPPAERSSHAMCARVREASDALAALESNQP